MRKEFAAYIPPDEAFYTALWKDALVVLDTNVVLNFYRLSTSTRDEVFEVLEAFKDRLWMPNQVGWEFFRRRAAAMTDNERDMLRALTAAKKALDDSTAGLRGRAASTEYLDDIAKAIATKVSEVEDARKARLASYNDSVEPILQRVLALFDGRCASQPDDGWFTRHYKEGKARYASSIPPGYEDATSKKGAEDRSLYGDYLLWRETLDHAKTNSKWVIVVTNDQKEDWIEQSSGQKLGPRREMLEEFYRSTGQRCWVYTVRSFLESAHKFIKTTTSDAALKEVDSLARASGGPRSAGIDGWHNVLRSEAVARAFASELGAMAHSRPISIHSALARAMVDIAASQRRHRVSMEALLAANSLSEVIRRATLAPEVARALADVAAITPPPPPGYLDSGLEGSPPDFDAVATEVTADDAPPAARDDGSEE